jgi:hypothetical protein
VQVHVSLARLCPEKLKRLQHGSGVPPLAVTADIISELVAELQAPPFIAAEKLTARSSSARESHMPPTSRDGIKAHSIAGHAEDLERAGQQVPGAGTLATMAPGGARLT